MVLRNELLPEKDEFFGGYTSLYGERGEVFGEQMPTQIDNPDEYEYGVFDESFMNVWGAAFRQGNFFPSLMRAFEASNSKYQPQEGYSAHGDMKLIQMLGGKEGLWRYRHSQSHAESMLMYERMREDAEDALLLASTRSGSAQMFAGLATPTVFAPLAPMKLMQAADRTRRFVGGTTYTYALMAPEQMLINSQNTQRDAQNSAIALTAASLLGGTLTTAFGKRALSSYDAPIEGEEVFRAAGAGVSPQKIREQAFRQVEREALEETGIGIEKIGWNPVLRMLKSPNVYVRGLATSMVDVGGLLQKKVRRSEEEMSQSVETTFRTKYMSQLLEANRLSDEAYLAYRGKSVPETDASRAFQMMKMSLGDTFKGSDSLTESQFRIRVGMAMRRGDRDSFNDGASEFVNQAAVSYRSLFNYIRDEAQSVRLFEKEVETLITRARAANNIEEVSRLEQKLQQLRVQGVTPNTARSYVPRIYRVDKINDNEQKFLSIIKAYAIGTLRLTEKEASKYADDVLDTVTHRRPFIDLEGATDSLDWVKTAGSAQSRTLEIPDELIEEFLENDIETLVRHHVRTMGTDIELTARFGDVDMKATLDEIVSDYEAQIARTKSSKKREELKKSLENDLRDVRGLRDRLRGTYGASKDPHAMSSRFVRVMKSINVLTGMGSAMISSVPDIARIVMVEGFENAYKRGFATLFDRQAALIKSMNRSELDKAAIAVDATLGLRAHAMSDMGDLFGSRYTIERNLNSATGMFFFFNGLNIWNQALKEIAGNVTALRMTESIMKPWAKISQSDKEKLLKNGIGQQDHMRMQALINRHGEQYKGEWLPNTDAWNDSVMVRKFRNALNQNVERIIVTPGAGDRALWTSTEFGSLLTQFKSYGQGSMIRMLTSGLQEKDGAFWQGAFLIVGLAAMVNEFKRKQYGIDSDEGVDDKLINAIDRSGILGWFMDVNNGIEKISDYKMGIRPFLTDAPQYKLPEGAKAGAVLGPAASNLMTAGSVFGDVITFNANEQTLRDTRFITPTGNLFYLDPLYDGVYGE